MPDGKEPVRPRGAPVPDGDEPVPVGTSEGASVPEGSTPVPAEMSEAAPGATSSPAGRRGEGAGVRWRGAGAQVGTWLKTSPYFVRWLVLGTVVGASAGLAVVAFVRAIAFADQYLLRDVGGYLAPSVFSAGNHPGSLHLSRPWVIPLLVAGGGVLAGLVALIAPEVVGSGTDTVLDAVHDNPRSLRLRSIPAKIVASACTIGSGGSGGPEGPSAQVAGAVGSWLTRMLDLTPIDSRVAVAIGIGSGIGSVFRAPLGGALLSAEILYRQDAEFELIIPSAIASIIGYTVFSIFQGFGPLMGYVGQSYVFRHPLNLVWFLVIGLVGAGFGLLYIKALAWARMAGRYLGSARWTAVARPAIGGFLTGTLAIAVPGVLGAGDGWAQRALEVGVLTLPLWFVLLMPLAKLVATAFSVGSGGSGGLFSPGMVIGAFTGAACWRLLRTMAPGLSHDPAPFVIIGMMCCVGSAARVPLAMMVMVAEMTSGIGAVAPALLAIGVATLIVRHFDVSLIEAQPRSRDDLPARRIVSGLPLLESVRVKEVMTPPIAVLQGAMTTQDALARLREVGVPGAPVVDERHLFVGVVDTEALARRVAEEPDVPVGRLADRQAVTIAPDIRASAGAAALVTSERNWLPVLHARRGIAGILTSSDLVRGYRRVLVASLRRISSVGAGTSTFDGVIGERSPLADRPLAEAALPPGTLVVAVTRGSEVIAPDGATVLRPGDGVSVLVPEGDRASLALLCAGGSPESDATSDLDGASETETRAETGGAPGTGGSTDRASTSGTGTQTEVSAAPDTEALPEAGDTSEARDTQEEQGGSCARDTSEGPDASEATTTSEPFDE